MKYHLIGTTCALLLAAGLSLTVSAGPSVDTDGDGVFDLHDNCVSISNTAQHDADRDGYGQLCDADGDQNGWNNAVDFSSFKVCYFKSCTSANNPCCERDHDCSGVVNAVDFNTFKWLFFKAVGPSGQPCAAGNVKGGCPMNPDCQIP